MLPNLPRQSSKVSLISVGTTHLPLFLSQMFDTYRGSSFYLSTQCLNPYRSLSLLYSAKWSLKWILEKVWFVYSGKLPLLPFRLSFWCCCPPSQRPGPSQSTTMEAATHEGNFIILKSFFQANIFKNIFKPNICAQSNNLYALEDFKVCLNVGF